MPIFTTLHIDIDNDDTHRAIRPTDAQRPGGAA
jgi:hypothetical protein